MHGKIVCTIGPASLGQVTLDAMVEAGMAVARLNMSHGSHELHGSIVDTIRGLAVPVGKAPAILADLAGPKIRTGPLAEEVVLLTAGADFILTTRDVPGTQREVSVSYAGLPEDVKPGDRILLSDGLLELQAAEIRGDDVHCLVVIGGELRARQGINLPSSSLNVPALTEKDRLDLDFVLEKGVDWVALSFVRSSADILELKDLIAAKGYDTPVMAKIEKHEALNRLDEIIEAADGVMVARGDLGVEIPTEEVPIVQKMIIAKAEKAGKPVVVATQMLDSMIRNPRPTRAEASDVANAVFDCVDAVMLSGETAIGKYPVDAVRMMASIISRTEDSMDYVAIVKARHGWALGNTSDAISYAACELSSILAVTAVITSTQSGRTARHVSRYRPSAPVVAVSPDDKVVRRLMMSWGVVPLHSGSGRDIDHMLDLAAGTAKKAGLVEVGDQVVITAGVLVNVPGTTNLIKVHEIY